MARDHDEELRAMLAERLELIERDPDYEGAQPTTRDQMTLALVGLVLPAVLMVGGWVLYGG
ncbi:MAG: hypothetical protein WEG56_14905 [Chloroflexota bacterium]